MGRIALQDIEQTQTDVAVLQVQFKNLDLKIDEVKTDVKSIKDDIKDVFNCIEKSASETKDLIKENRSENLKNHEDISKKVSSLEKWRWMLMGAGVAFGAVGFEVLGKIFGG